MMIKISINMNTARPESKTPQTPTIVPPVVAEWLESNFEALIHAFHVKNIQK